MYFRNYGLRKTWLNKSLKSPLSNDPSTNKRLKRTKHSLNLNGTTFTIFIDHLKAIELEIISLSDMQSLKNVC